MINFRIRTLTKLSLLCALALILSATPTGLASSAPQKMTADEVIAKHLESIGTAEVRAKIKSHVILGNAVATYRVGGRGTSEGGSVMASQETKSLIAIIYGVPEYPYEKMGFDGKTLTAGSLRPGKYSTLAKFFMAHDMPFREGLIGGTLSAAWPLLKASERTAKLKYGGIKKAGDIRAHVLEYQPRNDAGLKTTIYFDEKTFQHVRTEYERRYTQGMPSEPGQTQQQNEAITKLVEDFSEFKTEGGLTLPHKYKMQLSIESLTQRVLQDWVFTLTQFHFNRDINASEFDVRDKDSKS
jgi:outer membrane lipoprotein-sorting protein